ncbi:musculoskeletal embryonic nuclear protein 1-like [Brienomyrus brachyistius]|uniref:musculoskeletal embryonic nuclear protein 1-like n=1 Tax=Brienomyrus brachyistius TaxID=42636 RepID=UPI0020B440D8|nr:musculoskeletal embryonic nuclear protein 1-like [Brienomyrus brachyistius]
MSQPDDQLEKQNRPVMREEDLIGARETLGSKGPLRSKTFEVMDECERAGKAAPSVFSGVRSGAETAFQKPPAHSKKT